MAGGKKQLLIDKANHLGIPADKTWKVADIRDAIDSKSSEESDETKPVQIEIPKKYKAVYNIYGKYAPGTILNPGIELVRIDIPIFLESGAIEECDD